MTDFGFGPEEGLCALIVSGDQGVDVRDEVFDAREGRAVERLGGRNREPDCDLTKPVCRRVAEANVFIALEPHIAVGLVGGRLSRTTWVSRSG